MSAVEEYREFSLKIVFHETLDTGTAEAVAEGFRMMQAKADAAIAELEAEVARVQHMYDDELIDMSHLEWKRRAEKAEAELEKWEWVAREMADRGASCGFTLDDAFVEWSAREVIE